MTRGRPTELWPAVLVVLGSAVLFAVAAMAGWPGEPNACVARGDCFCEAPRPGWVRQPANTWSDLGFVIVGLFIGWHAARGPRSGAMGVAANRMTRGGMFPALYASIVVYMGPGSMYFHASLTRWGGVLDVLSMYLFITFVVTYAIARGWALSQRGFLFWFVGSNVALGGLHVGVGLSSDAVFAALVTVAIVLEGLLIRGAPWGWPRRPEPAPIQRRWLLVGVAAFLVAFVVWARSNTGGPWCDPESLWQGHAAWHILTASTTGCLYAYWRTEDRPPLPGS